MNGKGPIESGTWTRETQTPPSGSKVPDAPATADTPAGMKAGLKVSFYRGLAPQGQPLASSHPEMALHERAPSPEPEQRSPGDARFPGRRHQEIRFAATIGPLSPFLRIGCARDDVAGLHFFAI